MSSIVGTYDVLSVAVALPRSQTLDLIPLHVQQKEAKDTLFEVPQGVFANLLQRDTDETSSHEDEHIVIFQLGYQISTGPGPRWLPKMSFSECKLEIPYVRHPSGKSDVPMVYKQTILFSNPIISWGSAATGLTSKVATFTPPKSPFTYESDASQLEYAAQGFLEAAASQIQPTSGSLQQSWSVYKDFVQGWWFGKGTGDKAQRFTFDFEKPQVAPAPYSVELKVNLGAFKPDAASPAASSADQYTHFKAIGWRTRADLSSSSANVADVK